MLIPLFLNFRLSLLLWLDAIGKTDIIIFCISAIMYCNMKKRNFHLMTAIFGKNSESISVENKNNIYIFF